MLFPVQTTPLRIFVAAWPCPADPTPRTCIACGAYVVLLFSSDARAHAFTACVCAGPIASSPRARRCFSCDTSRPACGDPRRTCMAHAHVSILPLGLPHVAHTYMRMRTRGEARSSLLRTSRSACGGLHRACMAHARIGTGGPAPLGKEALRVSGLCDPALPSSPTQRRGRIILACRTLSFARWADTTWVHNRRVAIDNRSGRAPTKGPRAYV